MPRAENKVTSQFEPLRRLPQRREDEIAPSWSEMWDAAFQQENDVWNATEMLTRPAHTPQGGYDVIEAAKKRGVDPRDYADTISEDELDFRISKRAREEKNREVLEASGWAGYGAMAAAGIISPTIFIPFLRGATGMKSIAYGAASVLGGAAAQEAVLYANQETRTPGEVAFSLGASTILGGILGGVAHTMSKDVIDKIAYDMVNPPKELPISKPMPFGGDDLSAAETITLQDAGKLKKGWGADKLAWMSGITRNFEQWNAPAYMKELGGSTQLRKMTAGFSQASLSLQRNKDWIAASPGGNVEDLRKTYSAVSYMSKVAVDEAYIKYVLGAGAKGPVKATRAKIAGARAPDKLNYDEFKRQITLDIWSNFSREGVPEAVRQVAKEIDEEVYKKLYDEGVEVGIFTGKEKTVGDENYANRVYNNEVIGRRHEEFVKILAKNFARQLEKDFAEDYEKLREAMLRDKTMLEDIERPYEEVMALKEKFKESLTTIEARASLDVIEGLDAIKGTAKEIAALKEELDKLKKEPTGGDVEIFRRRKDRMDEIEASIKAKALSSENIKKSLGEELERYQTAIKNVRRRLANLSQANVLKDERLQKKLDKIEANEDAQVSTILRAQKQLQKFVKMLDSASDEKLDEVLTKFKDKFYNELGKLEKLEEKRVELEAEGTGAVSKNSASVLKAPTTFAGTKVADANGKPLIVYHGTTKAVDDLKPGSYFTVDSEEASAYTFYSDIARKERATGKFAAISAANLDGQRLEYVGTISDIDSPEDGKFYATDEGVYQFRGEGKWNIATDVTVDYKTFNEGEGTIGIVKDDNSARVKREIDEYEARVNERFSGGEGGNVVPAYLNIRNPIELSPLEGNKFGERLGADPEWVKAQIAEYKKQGYDGIVTYSDDPAYHGKTPPKHYIIFDSDQVKLAYGSKAREAELAAAGEDPALRLADRMDSIEANIEKLSAKIENLDQFDRAAWRAELEDMIRELADTHAKINAKRAVRNEKLWKQVENLSPEARERRLKLLKDKARERPTKFTARWNTRTEEDILSGQANFDSFAEEQARKVVDKIQAVNRRLAYSDIIAQERGAELARVLNIPSSEIEEFLETDIDKLTAIYTRTVGSDIAISRVFGSPDAAEEFNKLNDERHKMLAMIESLTDKEGKPLPKEKMEELQKQTNDFYDEGRKNLLVLLERAKGIRGLGTDPDAWSARAARSAMDLNYLRLMGGVVVNSVADVARPIMKYGLTRTFRDGFLPMLRSFKEIRMSQREAQLAGTATDIVMHTRAHAMFDIFDDAYRGTMAEKGLHYMSTRMGAIALFDYWTSAMKQFSAGIINAKLLDSIAMVMGDTKASAKELEKAKNFLARNNIDEEIATTIWQQVTNGKGGGKVNGVWLPNTESWEVDNPMVARARRAYRAALAGEVDATIITPGFERPNWVDWNIPARMLAQFKSFGMSSTQKTLMAGLQEHDAAFLNGTLISLAMGAVSYYLWATATGGDAYTKMQNALNDLDGEGWKVFADEAIERSGMLAVFSDVGKVAHRIPVLRDYVSFSGQESTRRAGGDLSELALGPSFDLMEKAFGVAVGIDEPTSQTLHLARQMLPFQNVFYLRQLLDKVEQSIDLPERRAQ